VTLVGRKDLYLYYFRSASLQSLFSDVICDHYITGSPLKFVDFFLYVNIPLDLFLLRQLITLFSVVLTFVVNQFFYSTTIEFKSCHIFV
jgi:hypothetical protein